MEDTWNDHYIAVREMEDGTAKALAVGTWQSCQDAIDRDSLRPDAPDAMWYVQNLRTGNTY